MSIEDESDDTTGIWSSDGGNTACSSVRDDPGGIHSLAMAPDGS